MKNYVLKKKSAKKKVTKVKIEDNSFVFKPHISSPDLIKIEKLSLYDKEMTSTILNDKLDKAFRKIMSMYLKFRESDDTEEGSRIVLGEIAKQKGIILHKYKDYLKKEERDKHLKRLKVLENEVKQNILIHSYEEEKSHSR